MSNAACACSVLVLLLSSCGSTPEAVNPEPVAAPVTAGSLYQEGHRFYVAGQYDTAAALLQRAVALDGGHKESLLDLAMVEYEQGMSQQEVDSTRRVARCESSKQYFVRAEAAGAHDAEVYDRICELSVATGDTGSFVRYARVAVQRYPHDRQYYNLGLACVEASQYQPAISVLKEAIVKFPESNYVGGYYRVLGQAYLKVDRDQTAERTFYAGLKAVDDRVATMERSGERDTSPAAYARLKDDRIGMLVSLRRLHQIYRANDKLEQVEKQLKTAGYLR